MLQEASSLMSQKRDTEKKQQVLDAFNRHFIISDEDLNVLTSSTEPVDNQFFRVLTRVKGIYKDCQVLLGSSNQTLGLEIMDQSSRNLNSAYQKLHRWIQREFKTVQLENPQISTPIRQALRVLAERPSLFQSCLDSFSEVRENTLLEAFHTALTGSSSHTEQQVSTKPIEFFAHDPLRYIGDMLAWTHSATVSEREALEVLFISDGDEIAKEIQSGRNNEPWSRGEGEEDAVFDGRKALEQLVNRDISGVARVLRQRIEQVIQSHDESILAYKIANLIKFYRITFSKLIGAESVLLDTLTSLEDRALEQFRTTSRDHLASIQHETTHPPPDLSIPSFMTDTFTLLKALLKSYDTSLIPASALEADFTPILTEALDPFLAQCSDLARTLPEPDQSIFTINTLLATQTTLSPFPFTSSRLAEITTSITTHAAVLVDHQHAFFLHTSGLQPLLMALAPYSTSSSEEDLARIPHLDPFRPENLSETSRMLDDFLPSALMDAMDRLKKLQSKKMVRDVTAEAAGRFCEDFEDLVEVMDAVDAVGEGVGSGSDEGGEDGEGGKEGEEVEGIVKLRALFPRTSAEIRVLLS